MQSPNTVVRAVSNQVILPGESCGIFHDVSVLKIDKHSGDWLVSELVHVLALYSWAHVVSFLVVIGKVERLVAFRVRSV